MGSWVVMLHGLSGNVLSECASHLIEIRIQDFQLHLHFADMQQIPLIRINVCRHRCLIERAKHICICSQY